MERSVRVKCLGCTEKIRVRMEFYYQSALYNPETRRNWVSFAFAVNCKLFFANQKMGV